MYGLYGLCELYDVYESLFFKGKGLAERMVQSKGNELFLSIKQRQVYYRHVRVRATFYCREQFPRECLEPRVALNLGYQHTGVRTHGAIADSERRYSVCAS